MKKFVNVCAILVKNTTKKQATLLRAACLIMFVSGGSYFTSMVLPPLM